MLELKNIILIILLGICIYLLIKMYSHTTFIIDNAKGYIIENLEEQFDDINDKFQSFEENLENKLNIFGKKINDIYSVQNKLNKFNEINKMNNQNILHQINQYEEELDDVDKNCIYNSIENMEYSPQKEINKNNCFVKIKENNNIKDLFYMSPKKSSISTVNSKSNNNDLSSTSSIKSGGKSSSQSKNSLVLEISNNYFKTNIDNNSPKSKDIRKILDDTSNAISRNNSFNDLLNLNLNKNKLYSENITENEDNEDNENNDNIEINDPPIILIPEAMNKFMNKKVIELK
jgi:hypothetical protein